MRGALRVPTNVMGVYPYEMTHSVRHEDSTKVDIEHSLNHTVNVVGSVAVVVVTLIIGKEYAAFNQPSQYLSFCHSMHIYPRDTRLQFSQYAFLCIQYTFIYRLLILRK
jgi:hypothetical protein